MPFWKLARNTTSRPESVQDHESAHFNPLIPNSKVKSPNFKDLMVQIYKYRLQMQVTRVAKFPPFQSCYCRTKVVNWVKVVRIRQVHYHAS